MVEAEQHEAAVLLRTEHDVARVLADASDEAAAYPCLLESIGDGLGWTAAALWGIVSPSDHEAREALRCVTTWRMSPAFDAATRSLTLRPGEGLPGRVLQSGESTWIEDLRATTHCPARRAPPIARCSTR